ncbi:MAG TPA: hypothetical protein VGH02_11745 [Rhizomicrobium sp.]|jgi:hypothetical protein
MATYSVEDDLCSDEGLRHLFDYLLPRIETNSTITYGEIAEQLAKDLDIPRIFTTQIGHVIGTLMNRILAIDANAPLLNLLVVNVKGIPGEGADGFIRDRFGLPHNDKPIPNRADLIEQEAARVFRFKQWPRIYRRLFGTDAPEIDPATLVESTEQDGKPPVTRKGGRGGPAEGPAHKALKAYVLAHPPCVGAPAKPDKSGDEYLLLSGDEIDVVFESRDAAYLVEVKAANADESDLRRGVYQCVKYRAVYHAQCKGVTPNIKIHAILALEEEPPGPIGALAKFNDVAVKLIERD